MDLNRFTIIGNLTSDIKLEKTKNDNPYCVFSVATNYTYKDKDGNEVKEVDFHRFYAWGKFSSVIAELGKKGKKVYVEARVKTRKIEKPDGTIQYSTDNICDNFIMLSKKEGGNYMSAEEVADFMDGEIDKRPTKAEPEINIDDIPY